MYFLKRDQFYLERHTINIEQTGKSELGEKSSFFGKSE